MEQQIQSDMAASQKDHDAAVAIKTNTPGWLQGAPLQDEQADVANSQAELDEAMQLQLQLQQAQVRREAGAPPSRSARADAKCAGGHSDGHLRKPEGRRRQRAPMELRVRACVRARRAATVLTRFVAAQPLPLHIALSLPGPPHAHSA